MNREGGKIIISVPDNFSKEWFEDKYAKTILKILREADNDIKEVEYKICKTENYY